MRSSVPFTRLALWMAVLVTALVGSTLVAPSADAAMSTSMRHKVLRVAASKKGTPYRYGATGPRAFDCSGYTRWVFARVGKHLPRTSAAQAAATRRIRARDRRIGDLVFFRSGGRVYHLGIYAGRNRIWHSPRTGERVRLDRIWTRAVSYGRVR